LGAEAFREGGSRTSKGDTTMTIAEGLLQELEQEAQTTKRVLERVPQAHLGWKPHEKSMSLGQLAMHIATVPGNVAQMIAQPSMQMPKFVQSPATQVSELLPALDNSVKQAREALGGMDDAAVTAMWRVLDGDREIMAMPRIAALRAIMLNHWYHHRGQMSVYLRQLNVPVPSIYGPSADENPFAMPQAAAAAAR
jgi:uncharacterized damage-inducible protein DinB